MIGYKLTDQFGRTKNCTQWGENVCHEAVADDGPLCSSSWIHYYQHPLLAILHNPIHANFNNPQLWECEISGSTKHDGQIKSGCKKLTTLKQIPLPEITTIQRIAYGILCAKAVYKDARWNIWADNWLSGKDRSTETANAANAAATAATAAYATAYATVCAAAATLDLISIAQQAMQIQ